MTFQVQTQSSKDCKATEDKLVESVSVMNGYWFYFQDGDDEIAIFGSGWSGKEIVYFNDNPVSEARNYRFTSEHTFTKRSKRYKVVYRVVSMLTGEVKCELYIDDELVEEQRKAIIVKGGAKKAWTTILIYFGIGMVFGYLGAKVVLYFAGS